MQRPLFCTPSPEDVYRLTLTLLRFPQEQRMDVARMVIARSIDAFAFVKENNCKFYTKAGGTEDGTLEASAHVVAAMLDASPDPVRVTPQQPEWWNVQELIACEISRAMMLSHEEVATYSATSERRAYASLHGEAA